MSNIGNIFGNDGWIQSAIDRSRFKTRPGEKRNKAVGQRNARQAELEADIAAGRVGGLVAGQKAGASPDFGKKFTAAATQPMRSLKLKRSGILSGTF